MKLVNNYIAVLQKYTQFAGRADRTEYWLFLLADIIVLILISILDEMLHTPIFLDDGVLVWVYSILTLSPIFAVGYRRVHDVGHKGWHSLIPIYNLYLYLQKSEVGTNKYGDQPNSQ